MLCESLLFHCVNLYCFICVLFSAPPRDAVADAAGPGEMGKPFIVSEADKNESKNLFSINSFNLFASDRISLNRSLPDVRPEG